MVDRDMVIWELVTWGLIVVIGILAWALQRAQDRRYKWQNYAGMVERYAAARDVDMPHWIKSARPKP